MRIYCRRCSSTFATRAEGREMRLRDWSRFARRSGRDPELVSLALRQIIDNGFEVLTGGFANRNQNRLEPERTAAGRYPRSRPGLQGFLSVNANRFFISSIAGRQQHRSECRARG